jgi:hypothetical protein
MKTDLLKFGIAADFRKSGRISRPVNREISYSITNEYFRRDLGHLQSNAIL